VKNECFTGIEFESTAGQSNARGIARFGKQLNRRYCTSAARVHCSRPCAVASSVSGNAAYRRCGNASSARADFCAEDRHKLWNDRAHSTPDLVVSIGDPATHQRYLIEKELVDEDDDDEGSIDLADTGKVAEYARMTDHELEALDQELHRQEKLLLGKQQAATDDSGRPEGLSGKMLEALEITAESEAVRLAQLQALLRLFAQRQSFRSGDGFVLRA